MREPRSPTARPLLRMRWAKPSREHGESNGYGDEGVVVGDAFQLLDAGTCFRFAGGRYTLCHEVGRGAHCAVWRCLRASSAGEPRAFALKVHSKDGASLEREASALRSLGAARPGLFGNRELFPRLLGSVRVLGRSCLAMPLYGPDLYTLQKKRKRAPFPTPFVWAVASHLISALEALTSAGLVHADIKPQNVVLRLSDEGEVPDELCETTGLCLIDLGSCLSYEQLRSARGGYSYVQSRWYRAPEVLLSAPCTPTLDCWSVGLVAAEVAAGVPLLPGESEYNQLSRIVTLLGPPPESLVARSHRARDFLKRAGSPRALAMRADVGRNQPPLIHYLPQLPLEPLLEKVLTHMEAAEAKALSRLLAALLTWDPSERISGADARRMLRDALATMPSGGGGAGEGAEDRPTGLERALDLVI